MTACAPLNAEWVGRVSRPAKRVKLKRTHTQTHKHTHILLLLLLFLWVSFRFFLSSQPLNVSFGFLSFHFRFDPSSSKVVTTHKYTNTHTHIHKYISVYIKKHQNESCNKNNNKIAGKFFLEARELCVRAKHNRDTTTNKAPATTTTATTRAAAMTATATPKPTSAATRKQPANNALCSGKAFTVKRLLAVSVHNKVTNIYPLPLPKLANYI